MSFSFAPGSSFSVPFWAHELAFALTSAFTVRTQLMGNGSEHLLNAPCSSISLSVAAHQQPIEYRAKLYRKGHDVIPRANPEDPVVTLQAFAYADTLAWRIDLAEAYERDGLGGVLTLLKKPANSTEKLRGQTQIANDYLWVPMPKGVIDLQRLPTERLEQLRFVTRRRPLALEEIVLLDAITLYALLCRPSFNDLCRRRYLLGLADMSAEKYADFTEAWGRLEKAGVVALLRPSVKPLRKYIKHLTD